ncbi:hypothetical protein GCM10011365_24130 [Marinicella pacifica]|uniref:ATP-grasp domain-containing protein n=1 Tax=Marinicella pacifica TaxID=1171543 RepID=A0A917FTN4_9GAMM|nr:ATP-grasp domain-containing protein [Marinicella pacifica]GGG02130.1 hypothetical protein GCM10011365_24130 [Marinicella pacifica]
MAVKIRISSDSYHIVIAGYRQQLAKAIHQMGVSYSVLTEKPLKTTPPGVHKICVIPFSALSKATKTDDLIRHGLSFKKTPTHVIAGTESGVFPAAVLRTIYDARRSSKALLNRCTDKLAMKNYLKEHNIPMAHFVPHHKDVNTAALTEELGLPVVVKDRKNSGGRNVVITHTEKELGPLLRPGRLYEQFIDAPEGSIESFIHDGQIVFSSITEYHTNKVANIVPAGFSDDEQKRIRAFNDRVVKMLNIKWGLTHLEYYRDKNGLLFGEIALRPPGGYIMELISCAYGFDPWNVFVQLELGIPVQNLPKTPDRICGVVLFHPGAGQVKKVYHPVKSNYPTLARTHIKVNPGDNIKPREGVGESVGHCFFSADTYNQIRADIDRICHDDQSVIELVD